MFTNRKQYKREIDVWQINLEHTNTLTAVLSKPEAYKEIVNIPFEEFDFDQNGRIDKEQFRDCLLANNICLKQSDLDEMFDAMDKNNNDTIDITEFDKYKRDTDPNKLQQDNNIFFTWNKENERYEISQQNGLHEIPLLDNDDRYKWMIYVPEIPKRKQKKFKDYHSGDTVNGYWRYIEHDDPLKRTKNEQLSEYEQLPEQHLNKIFSVLNYYYTNKNGAYSPLSRKGDGSPLAKANKRGGDATYFISVTFDILNDEFKHQEIEKYEYEMTWWNKKGRYDTTAVCIKNNSATIPYEREMEEYEHDYKQYEGELKKYEKNLKDFSNSLKNYKIKDRNDLKNEEVLKELNINEEDLTSLKQRNETLIKPRKPKKPIPLHGEIFYMRFNAGRTGLEWKWYDNNNSRYRSMGLIETNDPEEKSEFDKSLIHQLEASFLGNLKENFDPQLFPNLNSVEPVFVCLSDISLYFVCVLF